MRGEAARDRLTVAELWRTSGVAARLAIKLDEGPPRCHAWVGICRVLAPCHRADVAMLAETVYGTDRVADRVAMKALLSQLCGGGGRANHGHPYYKGGPYLKRVGRGWYAWPEDGGVPPSPARLEALLRDRPRTMGQLQAVLDVCADQVRRYMRALRAQAVAISRDRVRLDARRGGGQEMVYWIESGERLSWRPHPRMEENGWDHPSALAGTAAC